MFPLSPCGRGGQGGEGEHEHRNKAFTAPSRLRVLGSTPGRQIRLARGMCSTHARGSFTPSPLRCARRWSDHQAPPLLLEPSRELLLDESDHDELDRSDHESSDSRQDWEE